VPSHQQYQAAAEAAAVSASQIVQFMAAHPGYPFRTHYLESQAL